MKKKKQTKKEYLLILIASILLFSYSGYACSMYKITQDGKTIVGNNEDWINANTEIWFVPAGNNLYGVMNVGFDNNFTQGAINDAGLMFDGFAMPYLKVKNSKGKTKVKETELIAPIMHNYSTVIEVKEHLSKIDLSILDNSMLVFVDRSGKYLIVEGDELIVGNDAEQSFSNFYPSQNSNREEVNIYFYQKGLKHLKESAPKASFDYCRSVMNNFQQDITQYTTIYDLQEGKIRLYHYQNFDDFIELDLEEELKKGERKLRIPELFSKKTKGYQYYEIYNDAETLVSYYESVWETQRKALAPEYVKYLEMKITQMLTLTADEWVKTKKDKNGAIKVYQLILKLFPENKEVNKNAKKKIRKFSRN